MNLTFKIGRIFTSKSGVCELYDGDKLIGKYSWANFLGTKATVEIDNTKWIFEKIGLLRPKIYIKSEKQTKIIAIVHTSKEPSHSYAEVELENQKFSLNYKYALPIGTNFHWRDQNGHEVITYKLSTLATSKVEISNLSISHPNDVLLILLGIYTELNGYFPSM